MLNHRKMRIFLIFVFLFGLLFARIFYLQIFQGEKYTRSASSQRMSETLLEDDRGQILDRNGIPFTNRNRKVMAVLKPLLLKNTSPDMLAKACGILGLDYIRTRGEIEVKREPILIETDEFRKKELSELGMPGISFLYSLKRYDDTSIARHISGYVKQVDRTGEAGLEKAYDDVLRNDGENLIGAITDGRNNLVGGLGYRISQLPATAEKLDVALTLDYHIQSIAEKAMDRRGLSGAVVVEDVVTGDVLAMTSKPDFDQNNIARYLNSTGKELFNRATAAYNLGSIFKISDAAVLLEAGIDPEEVYHCTGSIRVGDRDFKCTSFEKGGHGDVNLSKAFAVSCNTYFIKMSLRAGYSKIIAKASDFGLGAVTGIRDQGISESAGSLTREGELITDGVTANTCIGQGAVMATPIQVANMVATVANGGIKNRVNLVNSVTDQEGNRIRSVKTEQSKRIMTREVSDAIRSMMEDVMTYGTGSKLKLDAYGGAGGKTGSAETGQIVNGEKVVQAWFVGYFPKVSPQYAIAVLVENGRVGGETAGPVFEEIMREMVQKGY